MLGRYLRSHDPRLPRSVRTMEAGGLLSAFGNRITFPFLVIYLHNVRGFSLATAGLVLAAGNAIGLFAGPVAGSRYFPLCGSSPVLRSESSRRWSEVDDVVAQGGEALAGDLLADEIADEPKSRV